MEQSGIELNMFIETKVSLDTFSDLFIDWVESHGWLCGGGMTALDEEGNEMV